MRDRGELAAGLSRRRGPPVVLASTHEAVLGIVPLAMLNRYAVDAPADPGPLEI